MCFLPTADPAFERLSQPLRFSAAGEAVCDAGQSRVDVPTLFGC